MSATSGRHHSKLGEYHIVVVREFEYGVLERRRETRPLSAMGDQAAKARELFSRMAIKLGFVLVQHFVRDQSFLPGE